VLKLANNNKQINLFKGFNVKHFSPLIILYVFINSLFVFKYASRQNYFDVYILVLLYIFLLLGVIIFLFKTNFEKHTYKYSFYFFTALFFIFTIYLNIKIDGNNLNVDRWSAMEVAIKALLNNEYPYSAIDHLNGRTSNLPALILIGIPFYFLGDVGYLQSFSFLLFVFLIHHTFSNYKTRVFGLFLLISSTSFWWEVYTKSDMMSNFVLILIFLVLIQNRIYKGKNISIIWMAIASVSLLLTRLTAVIPLSLLLVKKFFSFTARQKLIFISVGLFIMFLLGALVFKNYSSFQNFKNFNPFELQNRQLPLILSVICILLPFAFSLYIQDLKSLIKSSVLFLSIPIFLAFLLKINEIGAHNSIINSGFDISYFNIITPFLIFYLIINFNQHILKKTSVEPKLPDAFSK